MTIYKALPHGSSPLARGPPSGRRVLTGPDGIIPARAGSTERPTDLPKLKKDHPRSRGVHQGSSEADLPLPGSSPLARGAPNNVAFGMRLDGIIPARAGSTLLLRICGSGWQDHPRSRGVHRGARDGLPVSLGSSPLARGPHDVAYSHVPALVDHPRSRGVHTFRLRSSLDQ